MRKLMILILFLAVTDVFSLNILKEKVSLSHLREAGIPVEEFEKAGMAPEDMELFLEFWDDIRYFPLAVCKEAEAMPFSFSDTWMEERTYGGKRKHAGCDIFGKAMIPGYYPVVSITEGIVEKVGWLPLGGWRMGVRSPGGGYFYYAHLSGYSGNFSEGDKIHAGEILGFMGDSGYGPEGTRGKFAPHLHMGIYVRKGRTDEYALNPYPMLVYLQKYTKKISY